jgi:integrase
LDSRANESHVLNPPFDFKSIGKHMPRRRLERGYVYKVGKRTKMWEGRYHVYVTLPDGTEKRRERTKVLGACAKMSKGEAEQALVHHIALARGRAGPMPDNPTFSELWIRYRTLKEPAWSTATRNAVVSIFEGASKKKKVPSILAMIGGRRVAEITRDPLQECLNQMAARGDSFSTVKKARTYITAALEFALDENLVSRNVARKLEMPSRRLRKPCGRFLSIEEVRQFLSAAAAASFREHLIARVFIVCGLRAQELFVLRVEDIESGTLRVDEALKESEKGHARIGETKSRTCDGYVAISPDLEKELRTWLQIRRMSDPYHLHSDPVANDLLFPSETGTPYRIGNYLKRVLKPLAVKAGIPDLTFQALRRAFATHFQRYGSPKDAQAQLRHSKLEMTGWYMKQIPETVRAAVEKMDADLCRVEQTSPRISDESAIH